MCSPSPPPAPDYAGAATAQGAANLDAARAQGRINNPNVVGPTGSQTVTWDGDTPTLTQTLSPEQRAIYEQQVANQQGLGGLAGQGITSLGGLIGKPIDVSGLPQAPGTYNPSGGPTPLNPGSLPGVPSAYKPSTNLPAMPGTSEAIRQRVIDAMMSRANTDFAQREDQSNSDLIARGLRPGTEAYAREMSRIDQARNDARSQAEIAGGDAAAQAFGMDLASRQQGQNEAVTNSGLSYSQGMGIRGQAGSEQAQQFQQGGQAAQLTAQQQAQQYQQQAELRRQRITEILAQRQTPLNEITALMSGSQVTNPFAMPGAAQNTSVAPAPVFGAADAAGRYGTDVYNADVSSANSRNQALASMATTAAMFF